MAERWRKPAIPLAIDLHEQEAIVLPDGREFVRPIFDWPPEVIERMRAGYVCVKCMEPHEQAWPERCRLCGAPMRTRQAEYFAREFGGVQLLGPRTTLAEEIEQLPERHAENERRTG